MLPPFSLTSDTVLVYDRFVGLTLCANYTKVPITTSTAILVVILCKNGLVTFHTESVLITGLLANDISDVVLIWYH
jgi:hypothetical protein